MNNRIFIIFFIFLLVACQKEQPTTETSLTELRVTASVESSEGNTKTSLDDGFNVKWSVGDQILLTNGIQEAIYRATSSGVTTTFTKVRGDDLPDGGVYAYYPANKVINFSEGVFTANIPTVQAYKADGFADGFNPMTAKGIISGSSVNLEFKNAMSFVKLRIKDMASDKILTGLSLTSPSAILGGTATVTVGEYGVPTIEFNTGFKTVNLSDIFSPLSTTAVSAYIAVPVGRIDKLTITAWTHEQSKRYFQIKEAAQELTTARSKIYAFDVIDISTFTGKTFCPTEYYWIDLW